jgi:FlaA1/EpsC-like NDP-sugar epimerase
VVIYGAGDAGAALAREMLRNRALRLEPVGFLDDDATKRGHRVYGVEVLGSWQHLPAVVTERDVAEVIIALPRASGAELRRVVSLCESLDVAVRTLPGVQELLDETVAVSQIRPVRVEDLLRRRPVDIPEEPLRDLIAGKTVLVTGAGGSIGSEVSRQVANLGARRLILLDRAETPLFWIDDELARRSPSPDRCAILGDVAHERVLEDVVARERPDVIIHAAAHKHVPLSETNVGQTVLTNIRGTRLALEASARHDVQTFIFVSTDKAVEPTSVMGATKRWGERLVREVAASASGRYIIVRFGNVLGSQGSVTEVFRRQIAEGGPVTVTHADMTRYFMTIPEAVRLILLAGATGRSGDVHVLRMGEPVRIADLAHDLMRLLAPAGHQVHVEYVGLRPGERLEEQLFATGEHPEPTDHESVLVARNGPPVAGACSEAHRLEELAVAGQTDDLRSELFQ